MNKELTAKLIQQLKQGTAPWQKPWDNTDSLPFNPVTGTRYKGMNCINLMAQDYSDPRWLTYKQASSADAQVRRGEKGTVIQYWKFIDERNKVDENGKVLLDEAGKPLKEQVALTRPQAFSAVVFNAEQMQGLPPLAPKEPAWDAVERAEALLSAKGATLVHGGNNAYYKSVTDEIHLPDKAQFPSAENYYATALHELGHWTGHSTRLNRDLAHPFGSIEYAREELRAELASLFLNHDLGLAYDPGQHAAYVDSWIQLLTDEPNALVAAARDAEKIQSYLTQTQRQTITQAEPAVTPAKIFLNVPYAERGEAKAAGAEWDKAAKAWFIKQDMDTTPFTPWLTARQYLQVPYAERHEAKAAGAEWDKAAKAWYVGSNADMTRLQQWQAPANPVDPRQEFAQVLKDLGCLVTGEHPIMNGQKQRIQTAGDKPGETAGFYVGHLDNHPAGYAKDNRSGLEVRWKSKGYVLPEAQRAEITTTIEKQRLARMEELKLEYADSAARVVKQMQQFIPVTTPTPYLHAKGIMQPLTGIFTDQTQQKTYIPATDSTGKVWSLQTIHEDGTKRFARGTHKTGCFHALGGVEALANAPMIVIAEGYATAASLAQALGHSTVAAFDAGNLKPVAQILHHKFPEKVIVIAGDDDRETEIRTGRNPGYTQAISAAVAANALLIFPLFSINEDTTGLSDFNDLAQLDFPKMQQQVKSSIQLAAKQRQNNIEANAVKHATTHKLAA